jgi:hypothetical protein
VQGGQQADEGADEQGTTPRPPIQASDGSSQPTALTASTIISPRPLSASPPGSMAADASRLASQPKTATCTLSDTSQNRTGASLAVAWETRVAFVTGSSVLSLKAARPHSHRTWRPCSRALCVRGHRNTAPCSVTR